MTILQQTTEKVNAFESFMLTIVDSEKKVYNFFLPLLPFGIDKEKENLQFKILHEFQTMKEHLKDMKEPIDVVIDYTDDPTPKNAGSVVSLGYPLIRIECNQAKLVSYNPLTFNLFEAKFKLIHNREQRDSLIEMPKYEILHPKIEMDEAVRVKEIHIPSTGFEKPVFMLTCLIGKTKFHTIVEMLDLTTFYHTPDIIYHLQHESEELALIDFERLKGEWLRNASFSSR